MTHKVSFNKTEVLNDYRIACESRQVSLLGRKEVLTGKAKFGIFGDGKELPQAAMAHAFQPGDWRSGYYRDQTLVFATGMLSADLGESEQAFFAQLYAHADVQADPASAGRMMDAHFGTRSTNPDGTWRDLTAQPNSASDVSPTASQMPRAVGLAYVSIALIAIMGAAAVAYTLRTGGRADLAESESEVVAPAPQP